MTFSGNRIGRLAMGVGAAVLALAELASAGYYELLQVAPDSANVLFLINVEALRNSPVAQKENWADRAAGGEARPLSFPPGTQHALMASKVDVAADFRSLWDTVLIETGKPASAARIAQAEGGYVDEVEGFPTIYLPRGGFAVVIQPQVVGAIFPPNRQELGRWLGKIKGVKDPVVSPYLQKAVVAAHGAPQIVLAMDTAYLLSPAQIKAKLANVEALKSKTYDANLLAGVLASLKGLTLTVEATEVLEGKLTIDFDRPTAPLKDYARDVILSAVENQGLAVDSLKDWRITVAGTTVVFQGRLSTEDLLTLAQIVAVPTATLPTGDEGTADPATAADAKVAATRKYYKQIDDKIKEFRAKVKADPGRRARVWADRFAAEIDRMPILNVDDDMVNFGVETAQMLRSLRNIALNVTLERDYNQATVAGNQGYGYGYGGYGYGYGGFYNSGVDLGLSSAVMAKQSVAIAKSQELQVWAVYEKKAGDIRRAMTRKYQVEF